MAQGINRGKKCNNAGIKNSQGETDIILKKYFINFLCDKDFKVIKINNPRNIHCKMFKAMKFDS